MSVSFVARRRLLGTYLIPQRGRLAALAVLLVAEIALRLANPQVIRYFIDTAQAGGPLTSLTAAAGLFLVIGLDGRFIALGSTYAALNTGWTAMNRLRTDHPGHPAILAVSNRRAALRRADHLVVLRGGRVVAEGKLETLLRTSEDLRRLWSGADAGRDAPATEKGDM